MSSKLSKKLRKFLRQQFELNKSDFSLRDEVIQHNFELQKQLQEKQKEIDALCEVVKAMQAQQQQEAEKDYEQIPEILK